MLQILLVLVTLAVEVDSLGSYPYEYYLNIPGPKRFDSKIAIVGAGSSGVHMAHLLKQKGFTNVVILEKSSRVGGKSFTIPYRGAYIDMGSVVTGPNRHSIHPLVSKYLPGEILYFQEAGYWTSNTPYHISQYLIIEAKKHFAEDTQHIRLKLFRAIQKYIRLHKLIFGDYEFALMPKPNVMGMYMIRGTFEQFLRRNNLMILIPLFEATVTSFGYTRPNEAAALYYLMYNTPKNMKGWFTSPRSMKKKQLSIMEGTSTLMRGTQSLWEEIVKKDRLNVQFNVSISKVHRVFGDDSKIWIHKKVNNGKLNWEVYDFLIWSPELKISLPLFTEVQPMERKLLTRTIISYITSTISNTEHTRRSFSPSDFFMDNLKPDDVNVVLNQLEFYGIRHHQYGIPYLSGELKTGDDNNTMRSLLTYQVADEKATPDELREKLRLHFKNLGGNLLSVRKMITWRYFPRYSVKDIENGILWKILNMQGMYGMWYIGSSVSFESLRDVVEYNKLIVKYMEQPYY